MSIGITEAKNNWEDLLGRVEAGEPQLLTRYGKDVAIIVSMQDWQKRMVQQVVVELDACIHPQALDRED